MTPPWVQTWLLQVHSVAQLPLLSPALFARVLVTVPLRPVPREELFAQHGCWLALCCWALQEGPGGQRRAGSLDNRVDADGGSSVSVWDGRGGCES